MELSRSYYVDSKLYEIPYQMKANGYMYNKALFEQAGITEVPVLGRSSWRPARS